MVQRQDSYASYWKFALADSQLGKGTFSGAQMRALEGKTIELDALKRQSLVSDDSWLAGEQQRNTIDIEAIRAWAKQDQADSWVRCVVYPYIYLLQANHQHGQRRNLFVPEMIAPVSFTVLINVDGTIKAHGRPGVSRELLEPAKGARTVLIGSVDALDSFYDANPFPDYYDNPDEDRISLSEVLDYSNRLLDSVCEISLTEPMDQPDIRYVLAHHGMTHKARQSEASNRPLMEVYDAITRHKPDCALLAHLTKDSRPEFEAPPLNPATIALRSGSMKPNVSLGEDQRLALGAALSLGAGETLAVNGPPGTGKTTMIQSVVASLWVNAAIAREEPPLIVVASTNNQAVTNVLETFSWVDEESLLFKRWLEGWDSFGLYLPSFSKQESASLKGYSTKETMEAFEESLDIENASSVFVAKASEAFNKSLPAVEDAILEVRTQLLKEFETLRLAASLQKQFMAVKRHGDLRKLLRYIEELQKRLESEPNTNKDELGTIFGQLKRWVHEMAQLFNQATAIAKENAKNIQARKKAIDTIPGFLQSSSHLPIMGTWYQNRLAKALKNAGLETSSKSGASSKRQVAAIQSQYSQAIRAIGKHSNWVEIYTLLDSVLDRGIRPRLFALSSHWFEGSWLIEMRETLKNGDGDKRTKVKVERMWRRRSKLTPCLVATFHTLPKHLNYWDHRLQREVPLFNAVDWLINDEAGQCSPEVAGASIALSKRLLAVGDCWQIEPVWNIEPHVDMGNLVSSGIVQSDELEHQLDALEFSGRLASSGSSMKMSQAITRFGHAGVKQPGITLTTHRRCVPTIIQFCNELCYEGILNPVRKDNTSSRLPALGYLHVPGQTERIRGSRVNLFEASVIALWLKENADEIMAQYPGQPLSELVGIITPFKEQARTIVDELKLALPDQHSEITVGTIHALQGAERSIIMFSPTYSSHQKSNLFFDSSPMMLNVAVSRAKDAFLVVGDMDTLRTGQKPSRLLYDHLNRYGRALDWSWSGTGLENAAKQQWNEEIGKTVVGHDEHQELMTAMLADPSTNSVIVVSPILTTQSLRRYGEALIQKARTGCSIEIVLSKQLCSQSESPELINKAVELLTQHGVRVHMAEHLTWTALFTNSHGFSYGQGSWLGEDDVGMPELRSFVVPGEASKSEVIRCLNGAGIAFE